MGNNLRALRDGRGWTQAEAAAAFGTTRNHYAKLEGGSRPLSDRWITLASEAFGVDPGDVVTDRLTRVPLAGVAGASTEMRLYADGQGPLDDVAAPDGATPHTVACEISGDSLGPLFDGWLAFFDGRREPVAQAHIGQLCAVGLADGRVLVKRVARGRGEGLFCLSGQFGDPLIDVEVAWASRVTSLAPR